MLRPVVAVAAASLFSSELEKRLSIVAVAAVCVAGVVVVSSFQFSF